MTLTQTTTKTKTTDPIAKKDTAYYLSLPYRVEVIPISTAEGGGYTACIPLLGRWSAVGDGKTAAEAIADLQTHLPGLIEQWLHDGISIPEPPGATETLSGTLSLSQHS
jgi:predicted RNase H-like HicB family nuclease